MEESKDIKQKVNQTPQNNDKVLPIGNPYLSDNKENKEKNQALLPGRISNALTANMTLTVKSVYSRFGGKLDLDKLPEGETLIQRDVIDKNGNIVKLSAMQNRVIFSLCKQMFSGGRHEFNEYMELIKNDPYTRERPPRMWIVLPLIENDIFSKEREAESYTLPDFNNGIDGTGKGEIVVASEMSGDVFGKGEKGKPSKIKKLYSVIQSISKIKVPLLFITGSATDENGKTHHIAFREFAPYIAITGYEAEIIVDDKKYTAIEIQPSRILFEKNWIGSGSRSYLLGTDALEARLPSGRKQESAEYWVGLFPYIIGNSWSNYFYRLEEVKKQIKKENIIDSEKIKQLKEDALTISPIPFQTIRDIINFKSKHNQEEARFKKRLWEAIWALIDRGIVTEKSSINWDKETFTLVLSETREPLNRKPGGEWAKYSPKRKKRSKKSNKGGGNNYPQQQDLFSEKV